MTTYDDHEEAPPSRRFTIVFTIAMTIVAIGWVWVWQARTERVAIEPVPPVAVVGVEMPAGEQAGQRAFMEELAGSLAGITGLTVAPVAELYASSRGDSTVAAMVTAARAAQVPQVLIGTLSRNDGVYRLELDRVDALTRSDYGSVTAEGATHDDVIRSITAHLAMSLGLAIPR